MARAAFVVALLSLVTLACGPRREPEFIEEELAAHGIEVVHLMPIVDIRADPFDHVAMMKHLRDITVRVLEDKGYTAVPVVLSKDKPAVTSGELARMSDAELAARAPKDAHYIVVVYLEDVKTEVDELGETTRVRLGGRLIEVAPARLLWRDFAYGESDLGGLLTVLSGPATSYEAAYDSVRALFATLPDGLRKG